ncbi:MAG: hypothetical protein NTY47_07630, partial [Candidatus Omnitrophica bacterium]|nr:hypothetical protein [Candidatus Omnitrophota bacterium]
PQGRACYSAREVFVFIRPVRADTPNALHVLYHEIGHGVLLCEWGSVPFWVPKTGLEEFMGRFGFEALRAKVGSAEGRRNVAFEILWQIFESRLEKYREMSTTSVVRSEALRKNNFATSLSLEYMLEVPEYDLSRYPHAPWGGKRKLQ